VLVYSAAVIQLTWPLVKDLDFIIFGAFGDLTGGMATLRELVEGHHNPFAPGHLADFSAPDGRPIEWTQNTAAFSSTSILYVLARIFGAVPASSLFMLAGFVASGTAMFLLVRRLTGNFFLSLLIGWAFAFYPFPVVKAGGHIHFTHGWPFVLIFWRMLVLYETPSLRNAVIGGLAIVVALSWSPYYLLIGGVMYAALLAVGIALPLLRRHDVARHLRAQLACAGIVCVFAGLLVLISAASARGTGVDEHTLQALITYSARPFEYLVPPAGNAIFGDQTGPWLVRHIHGSNFAESTLYVGDSLVVLSLVALLYAVRRRLTPPLGKVVLAAAVAGVMALLFSAPPKVTAFGHVFPFPSLITFHLSGSWRVYSRFVMVVMLVVCVLAAIGLDRLLRGRPPVVQAVALVAVGLIVVVDLHVRPVGTNTLGIPPIYRTLERLPYGLVAEYPIEAAGYGDYSAEFYQSYHGKPIINGFTEHSLSEDRALQLDNLENPRTAGRLRTLGVRYVVVTHVPIDAGVQKPGKPGKGLRLIQPGRYASLYAVDARPLPLVTIGPGFAVPDRTPEGYLQWMTRNEGQVELRAPCSACDGRLELVAKSVAEPRSITLHAGGRTLGVQRVGIVARRISFPVRFDRRILLTVTSNPKPERVAGSPDPRTLSVSLVSPRLKLRSQGSQAAG
jgi:hypothetical protein